MVKLAKNANHYLLKLSKIEYFVGCLIKIAFDQVKLRIKKDGIIDFVTTNNLTTYLEIIFEDPNKKSTFQYKH